ncbi:MAG: thioredoxin family protein [Steroidobacteraceae bacterium]
MMTFRTLPLLAVLLATGCGRQAPAPTPAATPAPAATTAGDTNHLPPGIDWYAGDVDGAFAAAKSAGKPLFLYWGAEWCPPCAQVKSTIFNRREFQDRSRLFVPVYLDGDTPSAQKQGERFGVVGYPTMILFRADGTEITRLPGGVNVERYAKILDVALADARPVGEALAAATGGGEVSTADWQLLAYYDWGTDFGRALPEADRLKTFRTLASRCPAELPAECTRLDFDYLGAAAATAKDGKRPFSGLDRAIARRDLVEALGNPAVVDANVDNLLYGAKTVVGVLSDPGSTERRELTRAWGRALDQVAAGALSPADRLKTLRARVMLVQLDAPDQPLPPALQQEIRTAVAGVDASVTDPYARQAAINAAANLYFTAGMDADADRLLTVELGKSKQPYYFMLDLADIAQKAGRKQEAVSWLAKAYAGAEGPATRFQWGYNYLVGLLEMTPDDTATIERTGLAVLGELDGAPDAFYQRTRIRLDELNSKLLEWGAGGERAAVVTRLRARTAQICAALPEGDAGRTNCQRFLNPDAKASRGARAST